MPLVMCENKRRERKLYGKWSPALPSKSQKKKEAKIGLCENI